MSFRITSAKVVAPPGNYAWTQIYEYTPEDFVSNTSQEKLFILTSFKYKDGEKNYMLLGRDMITLLEEEYLKQVEINSDDALTFAVNKTLEKFNNEVEDLQIGALALLGEKLLCVAYGGIEAYVIRSGTMAILLKSIGDAISAFGYPQIDDYFILGTKDFFDTFSLVEIKNSLSASIDNANEFFTPKIHSKGKNNTTALFLLFEKKEDFLISSDESPIREKESFFKRTKTSIGKNIEFLKRKKIYLTTSESLPKNRQSKLTIGVGIILGVVLLISIFLGLRQKKDREYRKSLDSKIKNAEHLITESLDLITLDKNRSRELFNEGKNLVEQMEKDKVSDERLTKLKITLDDKEGDVLGEYNQDPQEFLDINLLTDGFVCLNMSIGTSGIFILNDNGNKLVNVNTDKKGGKVVAGPSILENSKGLAVYTKHIFVEKSDGIYEVDSSSRKKVIDKSWGENVMIYAYTGNIYVLDKGFSQIYRYNGTDGSFGSKKDWLTQPTPSLVDAIDWTIDGSIWVLEKGGVVEKYTLGNKDNFSLEKSFPVLINPIAIYSDDETRSLYILDPNGGQLVVYDKEGNYIARYISESLKVTKDLVVSEKDKKAFFLQGGKLMFIELKHL